MTDQYVCAIDACNEVATTTAGIAGKEYRVCHVLLADHATMRLKPKARPVEPPREVIELRAQLAAVTAERDALRAALAVARDHAVGLLRTRDDVGAKAEAILKATEVRDA